MVWFLSGHFWWLSVVVSCFCKRSQNHTAYFLHENDIISEEGKYNIFSAYVQEDGSLLVAGENSTIETNVKYSTDTYRKMEEAKKSGREGSL